MNTQPTAAGAPTPANTAAPALAQPQGNQPAARRAVTIGDLLQRPDTVAKFAAIAPKHLTGDRLMRVMLLAIHKTPKLASCHPLTLLGAMMALASLGLEPNTPLGHAYLLPFDKRRKNPATGKWEVAETEVQVIVGYKGYIDLARRSRILTSIHADVVYEGDDFSFEYGSRMHLRHVPTGARINRRRTWAYAHAKLIDGEAFEVLPYEQVLAIRNASAGYQSAMRLGQDSNAYKTSPWVAYEHEMAAKTMIRRLAKQLPLSIEFQNAVALDSMSERQTVDLAALSGGDGTALADLSAAALPSPEPDLQGEDPEAPSTVSAAQPEPRRRGRPPKTANVAPPSAQATTSPSPPLSAIPAAQTHAPDEWIDEDGVVHDAGEPAGGVNVFQE